ncbi:MAG TPA: hypothetical protein ENK18_01305 [Deltaproteobacteria bacterium]|nr:hypothetical protein [Deltaproteobacteria bacterium]
MSPPVLLVHGFLASRRLMWPLRRRLEASGLRVRSPRLSPLVIGDVRTLAHQLDAAVDQLLHETHIPRVDVVGASQGGILALWWAHHIGGWSRLRRLVLLGAPVQGTWAATAGLPVLGAISRGIWQMLPGTPLVQELSVPLPPGAEVYTLSLQGDPVSPPARCQLPGAHNRVFSGGMGPLTHQWLMCSRPVARELVDALKR